MLIHHILLKTLAGVATGHVADRQDNYRTDRRTRHGRFVQTSCTCCLTELLKYKDLFGQGR